MLNQIYLHFIGKTFLKMKLFWGKNEGYFSEKQIWKKKRKDLEIINF
jgi:hypothetical protein